MVFNFKNPFKNVNQYSGELYHGTTKTNAEKILSGGFMISSKGSLHLGQGVYFYDNEIYAMWWMLRDYMKKRLLEFEKGERDELEWEKICCETYRYFEENFAIIVSNFQNINYLDLDNEKNKAALSKIYNTIYQTKYLKNQYKDVSVYD
ncbi:hypothetical protein MsAg5_02480 [Methanosarcinaceae archaeon Ag5]|uniref:Uncharacterized protein n=1 Tax=Methanolapillus africanus TaxID=3028297 RepID=A0AAE4MGY1_9EURY|nr:hypothetical protein [Methanosarcinaceae archaeon Ag5]